MEAEKRIMLRELKPPGKVDEDKDIEWLCRSFSLFTNKDTDKSAYKVFRALLESSLEGAPITSTEISERLGVTRGTVLFHLQKFHRSGLIVRASSRRYVLRSSSLEDTIEDIMRDTLQIFEKMKKVASDIDKEFGIEKRW
ncbi:MAG: helix-turn-helix transcriptional regulator [Candidatus Altiarchaeota archaeon]|nr:helix-turn-helix transcriptional regulator [Candidatus Altiarchaeota archaeon]